MKEQDIVAKIQKYIKAIGGYCVKTIVSNRAGIPDILACVQGRFIGIEVKTETGVVSALQQANIKMINDSGGIGMIARSVKEVADKFEEEHLL